MERNNMKVIFLDDSEQRQQAMKSILPCIIQTYTADETIEAIKKEKKVDYLFLDHDLGGQVYVDSNEYNTGMTVAKWLTKNKETLDIGYIILHSFNPAGAKNMAHELRGIFQFGTAPFMSDAFKEFVNKLNKEE
jgi:response regulator RpfG family c-di-GMP phosphodiesterase